MPSRTHRFIRLFVELGFRDAARPIEWVSLLALSGWVQFLVQSPEIFQLPRYAAFSALPPIIWAAIITGVIVAQLAAMVSVRSASRIRFIAMTLGTGVWVVIAFNFWQSDAAPISARTASAIAFVSAMTGVYLGWTSQRS